MSPEYCTPSLKERRFTTYLPALAQVLHRARQLSHVMLFKKALHGQRFDLQVPRIVEVISNGTLILDYVVLVEPLVIL